MSWENTGVLHEELHKRNTETLKGICQDNGIPRSGAKYEVIRSIISHIEGYKRQQKKSELTGAGDVTSTLRLEVLSIKSLETVYKYCDNFFTKKLDKEANSPKKMKMLMGLTQGTLDQIYTAVTGPKANRYNGKHGELAMETLTLMSQLWIRFFKSYGRNITFELIQSWCEVLADKHDCEAFGYNNLLALIGDEIVELLEDDDSKTFVLSKVDSVDQYGRNKSKRSKTIDSNLEAAKTLPSVAEENRDVINLVDL